ncbi:MAG: hypothetical protein QM668_20065 [Agriterribacter sp.]
MQNSFSFSRLWLLIKKQWFDNAKLYTLSLLAMAGLLTIILTFWASVNGNGRFDEEDTYGIFITLFFASGLIFASITFSALSDKAKGIYWLSIPATPLEKLLCGFFYSFIVFTAVYVAIFFIIQKIIFFFILLDPGNAVRYVSTKNLKEAIPIILYFFIALQALFMLGSVYFERFAFIKTLLAIFTIGLIFVFFAQFLSNTVFPAHMGVNDFSSFKVYDGNEAKVYKLPSWIRQVAVPAMKYIWCPVLLTAAYFRIKEKEI